MRDFEIFTSMFSFRKIKLEAKHSACIFLIHAFNCEITSLLFDLSVLPTFQKQNPKSEPHKKYAKDAADLVDTSVFVLSI